MSSYLITGSTRGIGLGLVQFLSSKPTSEVSHIFASGRKLSEDLARLIEANPNRVHFIELEVADASSISNAVADIERILSAHNATLDVLVNNAAISNFTPGGVETMTDLPEILNINVIGMHLVIAAFLPLLRKGKGKKIANASSNFGSVSLSGKLSFVPVPAYTVSKAAVNMLTNQYAHALAKEEFTVFCYNPGWVKTDMGGSQDADLTVEQSVSAIFDIISRADKESNGKFLQVHVKGWENAPGLNQYPGGELPW
ncbi:short-chain dehydrogenase-like protein [Flagelloscypha sp. PMI_526]|nr:short-chain dehydrogenase-like protein [Flagelloscypha sp. PMI_526]